MIGLAELKHGVGYQTMQQRTNLLSPSFSGWDFLALINLLFVSAVGKEEKHKGTNQDIISRQIQEE